MPGNEVVMDVLMNEKVRSTLVAMRDELVLLKKTQEELQETVEKQKEVLRLQGDHLKKSNDDLIMLLGSIVEYRDLESGEHVARVRKYTSILANDYLERFPDSGLTREKVDVIVAASPLHDIGKIAIPNEILLKPAKLEPEEFELIKSHTLTGCEIIEKIQGTWSEEYRQVGMEICHYHHERYDGNGYPEGISGEQIPLSAQLVAVADVYDALVSERVYKAAIHRDRAYRMIINGECGAFSPEMMTCFRHCREAMERV
jgi:putative two-component system response regulator